MANLKELLFWEKYRPKTLKQMILIPRIESIINNGVFDNKILYGTPGTGKSTLANILSEQNSFIKINASMENGIDVLRNTIDNYIDTLDFSSIDGYKVIYLDEFDRASVQLQDALKGYVETHHDRVRFIFTTNHIHKITPELRSRFTEICFNPIGSNERKFLYEKQVNYLRAICKKENCDLYNDKEPFKKIVNKYFPDLRKSIQLLGHIIKSGDLSIIESDINTEVVDVYKFIIDGDLNPIINYDYVMNNFYTNYEEVFEQLGRPFFEYLKEYHIEKILEKGSLILNIQNEYNNNISISPDPLILLINYILSLKKALIN
ncbi:AAA family ATPase [Trichloromonas sp.]|uniref:AAA family ATPase n=1 Tax=Trichloromonas sp. TaxID=3069249 RepID=UPI002A4BEB18|nr:AAA family ATPase [Trichloromonas sp.]